MKQGIDFSDGVIVSFIAIVFVAGIYMVFKFMRGGKK